MLTLKVSDGCGMEMTNGYFKPEQVANTHLCIAYPA